MIDEDTISEAINKAGPEFTQLLVLFGNHFEICESCKKDYFNTMEKISMKVVAHIKALQIMENKK